MGRRSNFLDAAQMMNPSFYFHKPRTRLRRKPVDQALTEWRGIDLKPTEKALTNCFRSTGDVISKVLGQLQLERRRAETEILRVWRQSIDPAITKHAQPTKLKNGTLFVKVDNSVWLEEIVRYRRHEIVQRLQHSFGRKMIRKISFSLG